MRFARGQRKDDVTHEYLRRAGCDDRGLVPAQVLFVGRAQEKNRVFRTEKRRAGPGPPIRGSWPAAVVNQFYVHCVDEDFGAFFMKFSSLLPL